MKKAAKAAIFTTVLLLSGTASACIFEFGFSDEKCSSTCAGAAGAASATIIIGQPELTPFAMMGCVGSGNPNS